MKTINPKKGKAKAPPSPPAPRFKSQRAQMGASKNGWHRIEAKILCDKKYQLEDVWGVRQPQFMTPDPLAVGGLFHVGRAWWFDNGFPTGAKTWAALQDTIHEAALAMALPVRHDAINRCLSYLDQYCTHWSSRAKPKVIGVEYDLDAPMIPGLDPRTARLDDVSEYPEANFKLCIGECKTTSESVLAVVNEYKLHGQPTMQDILWEMASNGERMHGPADSVLLDVVVKGYGKEKCQFGRQAIRITDHVKNWFVPMIGKHAHEAAAMTTETKAERRITSCTRMIGRMRVPCQFQELCTRGKAAAIGYVDRDGVSLSNKKYTQREGAKPWD